MNNFDFKKWLMENRAGAYSKVSLNEAMNPDDAFADDTTNRGDMTEINPAKLGMGQAAADRAMQKQDDENSDWVDNASMGVVAEERSQSTEVQIKDWEVDILGKDHIISADVVVSFHHEKDEYMDHRVVAPGGYHIDDAKAVITDLGVEQGDAYRNVNDPAYIKQIQNLINTDPKLNNRLKNAAEDAIDWSSIGDTGGSYEADLDEALEGGLTFGELPECVKSNFERNITVSVAFVKKDGTVRHMAFRRNLAAYVPSDKPKTDAQLSMLANNNLMNVYDTNAYIKALKSGSDPAAASKVSFRNFKLENVLAFMCKGKVYDMRERNQIKDRFGDEVYNQLTKNMISALSSDEAASEELQEILTQFEGRKDEASVVGYVMKTRPADPAERDF